MPTRWSRLALYWSEFLKALRADYVVYFALGLYLVAGTCYVLAHHGMLFGASDIYAHAGLLTYCLIMPFIVLTIGIARITHRLDRRRLLAYRLMFRPRRVARFFAGTVMMLLVLVPFEAMFASVKAAFSEGGLIYDKLAADIDRTIHLGHAPVRYLMSFAKDEWVLRTLEFNYDVLWFVVCFGGLYWVAVSPRADGMRLRYCASFFLCWIVIGNIVAAMFPTAGPAFYGLVTGDTNRFSSILTFLQTTTGSFSSAYDEQAYLWSLHQLGQSGFGSGISAFPSVHVALITVNALFIGEYSRRWAIAAWSYVGLIVVSSVYLGWHYGIDAYAAIALVTLLYWAISRVEPRLVRLAAWQSTPRAVPIAAIAPHFTPGQLAGDLEQDIVSHVPQHVRMVAQL